MINERINRVILELFEGNSSRFAKKIGVKPGQIANYTGSRKSIPRADLIERIVITIDVINPDWLITGRGEMLLETSYEDKKNDLTKYLEKTIKEKNSRIEELSKTVGEQINEIKTLHAKLADAIKDYPSSFVAEGEETYKKKSNENQ
jgi:transcriptional regulator with XRE-family HTH domain